MDVDRAACGVCDYEVIAPGQSFCFISPMSSGEVGRNSGRRGAWRALQQESGEDTQMTVMELIYRSLFNSN